MNNYSWNPLFCQRFSMPFPFLIYEKDRPSHRLIIHRLKSLQFGNLISTFLRMLPFMSLISEHIEDFPHNPVDKHRHPNGNQAKVTNISEYVSKHDSKYPHGKNSNTHRPDYIACCLSVFGTPTPASKEMHLQPHGSVQSESSAELHPVRD